MPHHFTYETNDGTMIHAWRWTPTEKTNEVRGIIQIAHGMAEHILRYDHFARFLTQHGFVVYGNNHRGHGKEAKIKGFFSEENGFAKVVDDMRQLTNIIQQQYNDIPVFIFGHSMGSFLTRRYMQLHGINIAGVILSGTAGKQGLLGRIGLWMANRERNKHGATALSPRMNELIFGSYNKKFKPNRTEFDFLSRDERAVDAYVADEQCGFVCTTSFYVDLISGMRTINKANKMMETPLRLPIFMIAGDMDPVGNYGKGVKQLHRMYETLKFRDLSIKLYDGARHELLHETNKEEVYNDILHWLLKRTDYIIH